MWLPDPTVTSNSNNNINFNIKPKSSLNNKKFLYKIKGDKNLNSNLKSHCD